MYACLNCGKEFKQEELEFIRCPYCGGKVLFKKTAPTIKKVKAE